MYLSWNVRNVGLILFSTLVHRSLATAPRSQDLFDTRANLLVRQTLFTWHNKYPSMIPFITDCLRQLRRDRKEGLQSSKHSPLFPILIIIRSLRWSVQGKKLQDALLLEVTPYLSSSEWQVND